MKYIVSIFIAVLLNSAISVIDVRAENEKKVVLFDQGHGQAFLIERTGELDLSGIATLFRDAGFRVKVSTKAISQKVLSETDALIISGPFIPFSAEEIKAINDFIERGGFVAVMIHVSPILIPLLEKLEIESVNGIVNESENIIGGSQKDFFVNRLEKHPLTQGVRQFSIYGAWGLSTKKSDAQIIAKTGPKAWIDSDRDGKISKADKVGEIGIIVAGAKGNGQFVIFGDDAIFQNKFLKDENLLLGKNLADWIHSLKLKR